MTAQYPSDGQLERVRNWEASDLHGLMDYVKTLWAFNEWGWNQDGSIYYISTGGWSGNEDIIVAMMENIIWWAMFWQQSTRGGHYIFAPIEVMLNLGKQGTSSDEKKDNDGAFIPPASSRTGSSLED